MANAQCSELLAVRCEEVVGSDDQCACVQLGQACKDIIEVALAACTQNMELQTEAGSARAGTGGLTRSPMTVTEGSSWCSSSNRFGATSMFKLVTPVRLPLGWLRLATSPTLTGSAPIPNTIGMLAVAPFAASAEAVPPAATSTAT